MTAVAALLPDGRLHLQHGPIDCLCRAWGTTDTVSSAYARAAEVFETILPDLCAELPRLRAAMPSVPPAGAVGRAMHAACAPFADRFITPMAAVAGAVADRVLAALVEGGGVARAFVNNGGDIAFHLADGECLRCGLVGDLAWPTLDGVFTLESHAPSRGIATSGRATKGQGGRSFSFGIADAVTVLARTAAKADAGATVVGNAVDLPGHVAIFRRPACAIDPDSDLGGRVVTWAVGALTEHEIAAALDGGRRVADALVGAGLIDGAVLLLRGRMVACGPSLVALERP